MDFVCLFERVVLYWERENPWGAPITRMEEKHMITGAIKNKAGKSWNGC